MKYTVPLGVAGIIAVFSSSADQVVVGGYLTPLSLAVYNAAVTVSGVLGVVLVTPLTTALLPEASSSIDKGHRLKRIPIGHSLYSARFVTCVAIGNSSRPTTFEPVHQWSVDTWLDQDLSN